MNLDLLIENLTNPALLFFLLGLLAVSVKSDLEIPPNSSKFISLYLLFAIGFRGGHELAHEDFNAQTLSTIAFGIGSAIVIPAIVFFLLRKRLGEFNAGAIAASYGSVSAVTFVTAVNYLEVQQIPVHGHMVAVMAMMESPAIIMGLLLISMFSTNKETTIKKRHAISHSFTNGSVLLILGSLLIGFVANDKQAQGIEPFTNDLFKGFLAIFLLDMGIVSGRKIKAFTSNGVVPFLFALITPLLIGCLSAYLTGFVTDDLGDRFLLSILAASASYIAVPAAMKIAVPQANPGLYLPMALAITFPVNITIGMPLYFSVIQAVAVV
ncbi:MAG: sodium-dependent bicarbonate transport family permease [Bacteroidota bacterium]